MPLSEAKARLHRAKEQYRHAVANVDRMLKPIVANHPEALEEARAFQRTFTEIDYTPLPLTDPHAGGGGPALRTEEPPDDDPQMPA